MVEFILTGAADPSARIAKKYLYNLMEDDFFFVKIKDETKLILDPKDYENDISLKGEFIRHVMASVQAKRIKLKLSVRDLKHWLERRLRYETFGMSC